MDFSQGSLFNRTIDLMGKSLGFRLARHNLTTSNLANLDTPGYRVRDLKFENTLQRMLKSSDQTLPVSQTHQNHMPVKNAEQVYASAERTLVYSEYGQDDKGKDILDIDQEMTKLAKNHLLYNTTVQMLAKELENLKYAITEGGR